MAGAAYTVTVNLTAAQNAGATRGFNIVNANRASQNPPGTPLADVPAFLALVLTNAANDYVQQLLGERRNVVGAALDAAGPAMLTAVANALGVTLPT